VPPNAAAGAGLYEDFAESSSFILSPRVPSISAFATRTEDEGEDAFLYSLHAAYAVKSAFLLQAEQSYATISSPGGIKGGFGDFRMRLRAKLYSTPGRIFYFTSVLRSGSGSQRIFPFASGSIDASIGFALVDSLSLFTYWGEASASGVWHAPEGLSETSDHDNFAIVSAGITFPVHDSFELAFFGAGYILLSGPTREMYGMLATYRSSSYMSLFASLQAEGGKKEDRVTDTSVSAGARIYY